MTETRQQIIEIIEPYMNKTLSFGCILRNDLHSNILKPYYHVSKVLHTAPDEAYWIEIIHNPYTDVTSEIERMWGDDWEEQFMERYYILWHYDITAVLKFIEGKLQIWDIYYEWDYFLIESVRAYQIREVTTYWKISNKPLHLYTDQQDKNLLTILQKFQWTNKNDSK